MKKKQQDTAEVKRLTVPEGYDGPMLDIRDLRVIYKTDLETVEAINGISLRIGKGKTFGLVGETGAGKTTTALSILRLLPHNTGRILNGEILFNGVNLLDEDEEVMRAVRGNLISMVFQDPMSALNPVYTVGDQIGEAVALHNPDFTKEQVEERVDEALDVTIQAQVLAMIRELRDRLGTSMLMITHDLGIVAQTCDDVGVMYAGEIIESGTVEDIFLGDRHHPYTVGLFDSIPNLTSRATRLKPIPGLMPDPTALPDGCVFADRCSHCMEICSTQHPQVYTNGTHKLCCHLFDKELERGGQENGTQD